MKTDSKLFKAFAVYLAISIWNLELELREFDSNITIISFYLQQTNALEQHQDIVDDRKTTETADLFRLLALDKLVNDREVLVSEAASVHHLEELVHRGAQRCARLAIVCGTLCKSQIFGQVLHRKAAGVVAVARCGRHNAWHRIVDLAGPIAAGRHVDDVGDHLRVYAQTLAHQDRLACAQHSDRQQHVVAELRHAAGSDGAGVENLLAHVVQVRLDLRYARRFTSNHEGQRSGCNRENRRSVRQMFLVGSSLIIAKFAIQMTKQMTLTNRGWLCTGNRSVVEENASGLRSFVQRFGKVRRNGRTVDQVVALLGAGDQTDARVRVDVQADLVVRQHCEHRTVALFGHLSRTVHTLRLATVHGLLGRLLVHIVHDQLSALLDQVPGHVAAHHTETDEADFGGISDGCPIRRRRRMKRKSGGQ